MAIKADKDGFLVGNPVELDTRWMQRVLSMVGNLAKDMAEVRRILAGQRNPTRTGQKNAAASQPRQAVSRPVRAGQPLPERVQPIASAVSPQRQARAIAAAAASMAARDAKGRFIGKPGRVSPAGKAPAAGDPDDTKTPKSPRGGDRDRGRFAKLAGDAAKEGAVSALSGTSQVDPVLGAVKEIGAPIAAVGKVIGGGLFDSFKDRAERKKEKRAAKESAKETVKAQIPWFKRIIEARGGASGGESGGGMLSGMLSRMGAGGGLMARVGTLLSGTGAGAGIKGLLKGGRIAGILKGGLGKAMLPVAAIMSAISSFNTSSEDYAKRYGTEVGGSFGKDILVRIAGVMQDFGNAITFGLADKVGQAASTGWNMLTARKPETFTKPESSGKPASTGISGSAAGGGMGMASTAATGTRLMSDLMRDYKLTPEQAAGFVGNLSHESGDFKSLQEIDPTVKGSRGGYGYAQWTGPRRRQFEAWAKSKGLDPKSYEANYGFLRHELDSTPEGAVLSSLRKTNSVSDATEVVSNQFLRPGVPHMGSRKQRATAYLAKATAPTARMSAAPTATPVAPASSAAIRASAKPSPAQLAVPPPPPEQARIGSNRRGKDPVQVTIPRELTQNVSDRGIAQLATGGMGGNMTRGVG